MYTILVACIKSTAWPKNFVQIRSKQKKPLIKVTGVLLTVNFSIFLILKINLFLTLKAPYIAADDILIFYFYLWKKIRLHFACEPSA